jgi:phospholipid-translocating ATPase
MNRLHHRGSTGSEKRHSGNDESKSTDLGGIAEEPTGEYMKGQEDDTETVNKDLQGPRAIFFNQPLPPDMLDDNGHPSVHYKRNKIRTAKYTPLSFIPKNLWFQFHNIANVYFLILIVLAVSLDVLIHKSSF